jgi:hypothetical protein
MVITLEWCYQIPWQFTVTFKHLKSRCRRKFRWYLLNTGPGANVIKRTAIYTEINGVIKNTMAWLTLNEIMKEIKKEILILGSIILIYKWFDKIMSQYFLGLFSKICILLQACKAICLWSFKWGYYVIWLKVSLSNVLADSQLLTSPLTGPDILTNGALSPTRWRHQSQV